MQRKVYKGSLTGSVPISTGYSDLNIRTALITINNTCKIDGSFNGVLRALGSEMQRRHGRYGDRR